jgi:hypothetical protein
MVEKDVWCITVDGHRFIVSAYSWARVIAAQVLSHISSNVRLII